MTLKLALILIIVIIAIILLYMILWALFFYALSNMYGLKRKFQDILHLTRFSFIEFTETVNELYFLFIYNIKVEHRIINNLLNIIPITTDKKRRLLVLAIKKIAYY